MAGLLRKERNFLDWSPLVGFHTVPGQVRMEIGTHIRIRPERKHAPLFLVHPLLGSVSCYLPLALHLGPDLPVYGLQSVGLTGKESPLSDIPEMACRYIREIRKVQPRGPYCLGGWCVGGVIAFEMARQLDEKGEDIALLALIDSLIFPHEIPADDIDAEKTFASLSKNPLIFTEEQIVDVPAQVDMFNIFPPELSEEDIREVLLGTKLEVMKANFKALLHYHPGSYPGRVTLFRSDEPVMRLSELTEWGWERVAARGVDVHDIPGDHLSIVTEPHARVLAEKLKKSVSSSDPLSYLSQADMTTDQRIKRITKNPFHPPIRCHIPRDHKIR